MAVDNPPRCGQADPGPWKITLAVEALESPEEPVGIDHVATDPVVLDEDARFAIHHLATHGDDRRLLGARELPGVVDEVGEQDAHKAPVARRGDARRDVDVDLPVGLTRPHLRHHPRRALVALPHLSPHPTPRHPDQTPPPSPLPTPATAHRTPPRHT